MSRTAPTIERAVEPEIDIEPLLELIRDSCLDFSGYRRASLARRIEKRMRALGMPDVAQYRELLKISSVEREKLVDAILINVTRFFRDDSSWAFLADEVVPQLVLQRPAPKRIRIWCAGCASGEEAYTLAMLFADALGMDDFTKRVRIHATDVDTSALAQARRASYTEQQVEHVPDDLRRRYFRHSGRFWFIREEIRRPVRFSRHSIICDPPIPNVDLLSCRNTLMYLNRDLQLDILARFHRALNDGGILFLGRAETLLTQETAFRPIDLKRRISMKVAAA